MATRSNSQLTSTWLTKNHLMVLWLIILLAFLLRLGAAFYLGDSIGGLEQARAFDQISYNAIAQSLLAGDGYSFNQDWYPFTPANTPTAHWSFIYPLYLAGVYAIFGFHPLVARIIQIAVSSALSIWLIYCLGKQLAGIKVGLVAAGLAAVYAYFVYYDATLMTESFFILGILAIFVLTFDLMGISQDSNGAILTKRIGTWILLGVVFGVTALLRQTVLLWLPVWLVWVLWIGRKRISIWGPLISLGILFLIIFPWTVRNYLVYNAFLPLNSNAGYALYSANYPDHGTQFDQDYAAPLPDDLVDLRLNEAQWNTALTIRGLKFIIDDPNRYLLLSIDRVPIFFNAWFSPESTPSSNLMRVLSFGLYLPFFLYGLVLSIRQAQRFSLIYLFAFVFSIIHIFIWASVRYRLPIDAVFMPLAAIALLDLLSRLGVRSRNPQVANTKNSLSPKTH